MGMTVEHSPGNPLDGDDARWADWYAKGLSETLDRCDTFVAVIDEVWDSSTWMGQEADTGMTKRLPSMLFWNPDGVTVVAAGMKRYLGEGLPVALDDAVRLLVQRRAV